MAMYALNLLENSSVNILQDLRQEAPILVVMNNVGRYLGLLYLEVFDWVLRRKLDVVSVRVQIAALRLKVEPQVWRRAKSSTWRESRLTGDGTPLHESEAGTWSTT